MTFSFTQVFAAELPMFQVFSLVSASFTGLLLILSFLRTRRQGVWALRALAAALTLWQVAEILKNAGYPSLHPDNITIWNRISFVGVCVIAPAFFWLALALTGRIRVYGRGRLVALFAVALSLASANFAGYVFGAATITPYGIVHQAFPIYYVFALFFLILNGAALVLLWRGDPRDRSSRRRTRVLFWAGMLGISVGALDIFTITIRPIFPAANLSAALYAGVLYWATFRYNYWGGRELLRELGMRALLFVGFGLLLGSQQLIARAWLHWEGSPWTLGLVTGALAAIVGPAVQVRAVQIYRRWRPAQQKGSALLLQVSRQLSQQSRAAEMAEGVCQLIMREFPLGSGTVLWSPWPRALRTELLGEAISRRNILEQLRLSDHMALSHRRLLLRSYRMLRRLRCEVLVPIVGRDGVEAVLCFGTLALRGDDWNTQKAILGGMGRILGDRLVLLRLGEVAERERHLGELGLMAAGLAHEIKNPLEGVYGAAQILSETQGEDNKFVDMILRETLRLNDVVQGFLRYARPFPAELRALSVGVLLEPWREQVALDAEEACPEVWADTAGVHQILLNLIENARRVQPVGLPVILCVRRNLQWVELAVQDQGGGIAAEFVPKLFQPFQTRSVGGNGLGLAMSRKIAQALGGSLEYVPRPGGSEFCLRLRGVF